PRGACDRPQHLVEGGSMSTATALKESAVVAGVMTMEEMEAILKEDWADEKKFRAHIILNLVGIRKTYETGLAVQKEGRDAMKAAAKIQTDAAEAQQRAAQMMMDQMT